MAGHARVRSLERRGLVARERQVQHRRPAHVAVGAREVGERTLTADQRAAVAAIEAAPAGGRLLLHGVTGSGKTEVYLQAVAATLARGQGAIVLVPEIALTPQTVGRFERRFGDGVAVLHSQLGQGERHDEWQRLRRGEARICVGPRSAVFAPIDDLGLIVVDEEHDASYKQEGDPRYDARAVAERRARACGAVLVAGSATPRPETVHAYERLALPERVDGVALPPVEILDMRGLEGPLHPATRQALAETRRDGGKAIVLLNRRGWSNFLTCRGCGRVWECPQCDVALVLHRADGALACHHCGHREDVPERCEACGSTAVARHGAGTERLEHELAAALGDRGFPVFRLDSDIAAHKGRLAERLAAFEAAPAGVLVGTQMVAKGHDFPDVTLGVVLDADATLRFPDFRAEERTFALVAQLAGRAGRGARGGRVLVQTLAPDAEAIGFAARHDADGFLAAELGRREALRYPPFAHLVRVVLRRRGPRRRERRRRRAARADRRSGRLDPRPGAAVPAQGARANADRGQGGPARGGGACRRQRRRRRGPRAPRRDAHGGRRSPVASTTRLRAWPKKRKSSSEEAPPSPRSRGARARATPRSRTCASSAIRRSRAAPARSSASTTELREEIERMGLLMHDALGIGLAATQLGVLHRVLVYRRGARRADRRAGEPGDRVERARSASRWRRGA